MLFHDLKVLFDQIRLYRTKTGAQKVEVYVFFKDQSGWINTWWTGDELMEGALYVEGIDRIMSDNRNLSLSDWLKARLTKTLDSQDIDVCMNQLCLDPFSLS